MMIGQDDLRAEIRVIQVELEAGQDEQRTDIKVMQEEIRDAQGEIKAVQ